MSKKKKKKAKQTDRRRQESAADFQRAAESRTAVAANVAWMLALMSTLIAEGIGLLCRWYTTFVQPVKLLSVLSGLLLLVAVVAGAATLILIPIVYKFNKLKPPMFITQVALLAGVLPLAVVLMQFLRDR